MRTRNSGHYCRVSFGTVLTLYMFFADMRGDVQDIFKMTPPTKQVMMFTATLQDDMRKTCKRFMNEVRPLRADQLQRAHAAMQDSTAAVALPPPELSLGRLCSFMGRQMGTRCSADLFQPTCSSVLVATSADDCYWR